ncbi:WecB/TagA/CpsF family glycosyltransferase [Rhodococcus sp. ENV425]|uniref:WecB/TagA/CpsF family glycosyltransferase n=1 Tax=Rhodococcus sp. ENV425 TaxID=2042960 RepID=UPI000C9AF08E|nr:WecB/TagA/CpsF family glycosyltransferase [Rhodococcus sp. ENV425]PND53804.1 glycosyltransferase [Rhodococcus sp. ENV425]
MIPATAPDSVRIRVGTVPFNVTTLPDAVTRVIRAAIKSEPISIRFSNAYCVALASQDSEYQSLLNGPGLNFPDGTPVAWFMKKNAHKKGFIFGRVRGPSLFTETLNAGRKDNVGHFFLGTTQETLENLEAAVADRFPGTRISGRFAPPFAPLDEDFYRDCAARVAATDAQLIWVALGTPKQDFVAVELAKRVGRPCAAVGAAFDFVAGTAKEAPVWMQNSGTEWVYRLATEPRRLWRRYLLGNIQFLRSAMTESA